MRYAPSPLPRLESFDCFWRDTLLLCVACVACVRRGQSVHKQTQMQVVERATRVPSNTLVPNALDFDSLVSEEVVGRPSLTWGELLLGMSKGMKPARVGA